jgi:hypothetical protein
MMLGGADEHYISPVMLDVRAIQKYFAVIVLHPKLYLFCRIATLHEFVGEDVLIRV